MNILFKDNNGNIVSEARELNEVGINDTIIIQLAEPIFKSQQDLLGLITGNFKFPKLKVEIQSNTQANPQNF